jgi:hypothetical protein
MNLDKLFSKQINFDINMELNDINFFFFGCWNSDLNVTSKIIEEVNKDESIQFGIVNGDNYYKTKILDENEAKGYRKIDDMNTIVNGFNILKEFPKTIYLTIGNHEVDNKNICETLLKELSTIKNSKILLPHNYYSLNFYNNAGHKVKIVILDVNLFDINKCYESESRLEKQQAMLLWLDEQCRLTPPDTQIIIVGHYPLFYIKKEKKEKIKKNVLSNSKEFDNDNNSILSSTDVKIVFPDKIEKFNFIFNNNVKLVYDILIHHTKKKFIYLASDTHNYQKIEHANILQYISGTGGAELDQIANFSAVDLTTRQIHIVKDIPEPFYIYDTLETHGYMIIKVTEKCTFNFFAISTGGSIKQKYCKYINKNMKLQKIICT